MVSRWTSFAPGRDRDKFPGGGCWDARLSFCIKTTGPGKENQTDVSGLEATPGPGLDHILEGPEVVPRTGGRLWAWKVSLTFSGSYLSVSLCVLGPLQGSSHAQ